MDYAGEKFLDKLYQELYMSDAVQHTRDNKDKRHEAIRKYLDRLERVHSKADTESKKKHLLKLYFDKYVIKEEDIPNGYDKQAIIDAQKKKIALWIEYLSDPNTDYPMWAKYWAFQGMLKMGSFDASKDAYLKRNKKTMAPFVDPNPEIIAKSIKTIMELVNGEEVTEDIEQKLNKTDSFSKIYSVFEKKWKSNITSMSSDSDGIWIKYNQGSKEDAVKLSKSLENKNTGWCTASENMAINQVCGPYSNATNGGDFWVYYTKDENGEYTIPRIAIRLENHDKIGEIRGILANQNLEESMVQILEEKLKGMEFLTPDSVKENLDKVEGLKELSLIAKKTEKNEELTEEELINLYTKRFGFGWHQDPGVKKITDKRNILDDFNKIKNKEIKIELILEKRLPKNSVSNTEILLEAIKKNSDAISYATKELLEDENFCIQAVKANNSTLSSMADVFIAKHQDLVLDGVNSNPSFVRFLSDESLIKNAELIENIVKTARWPLQYLPDTFIEQHLDMAMKVVKQDGYSLQYLSDNFKERHSEIVMEAVKQQYKALQYLSDDFKEQHLDILLEAVKQNGRALGFIKEDFLDTHLDIVKIAISNDVESINLLTSEFLMSHQEIINEAANYGYVSPHLPDDYLLEHPDIMKSLINNNNSALIFNFSKEIQEQHPEVLLEAVKENGANIDKISLDYLETHPEIVMEAAKHGRDTFIKMSSEFLEAHPEIVIEYVNNNIYLTAFAYLPVSYLEAHPNIVFAAERNGRNILKEMPYEFLEAHPEIVLESIRHGYIRNLNFSENFCEAHPDIIKEAIRRGSYFDLSSEFLEKHPDIVMEEIKVGREYYISYMSNDYIEANIDEIIAQIEKHPDMVEDMDKKVLAKHPEIMREAIKVKPELLSSDSMITRRKEALKDAKSDFETMKYVVKKDKRTIKYAPKLFMLTHPVLSLTAYLESKDEPRAKTR